MLPLLLQTVYQFFLLAFLLARDFLWLVIGVFRVVQYVVDYGAYVKDALLKKLREKKQ